MINTMLSVIKEEVAYLSTKVNCNKRDELIDVQACGLAELNNNQGDTINHEVIMLIMSVDDMYVRMRLFDTFKRELGYGR